MSNILKGRHGPLLIAEIGGNHEGDFEYAKKLTQLAIDTDVDMVKFQIYTGDSLVSRLESPDRNEHFKKFELSQEQHLELAKMVTNAGLHYTSSVWDLSALEWLDHYIPAYKIGSGDLTAYPILREIAQIGKPLIVSTGLSTEKDVLGAVKYIQSLNPIYKEPEMLAVLQCTSMYPITYSDAHLNVMNRLRELTGLTIGYSDHTEGSKALKYAAAMGAEVLEFHFTDERQGKAFRDHKVSLMPDEVKELISEIHIIKEIQGDPLKTPTKIELDNGHELSFRRAVYPSRDIEAGEDLSEENLVVLRPNHGIDARNYDRLVGKKLKENVRMHQKMTPEMVENFHKINCQLCDSPQTLLLSAITEKPKLETKYLSNDMNYYREIRQCLYCGVYFNAHDYNLFNEDFYRGEYNAAIEKGKLQKRFDRIINLNESGSDNKQRVKRILSFCDLFISKVYEELRVLDVGSGTGVFPYELSKDIKKVSAVDPDQSSVEMMGANIKLDNLWHGSLKDVPESEKFDLITFNKVLEHLKRPDEMLKQSIDRLASGGYIYIELPFAEDIIEEGLQDERAEFFIEHYTTYTFKALTYLLENTNLRSVTMKSLVEPSGKHTIYCFARIKNI